MKTLLLVHGPNLNMLGPRDQGHYGTITLPQLEAFVRKAGLELGLAVIPFQSNHEGTLIDWIQDFTPRANGIIINAGALTHYSYALHDALLDTKLPCIEVHLSDISRREQWRRYSVLASACRAQIMGKKEQGYVDALHLMLQYFTKKV